MLQIIPDASLRQLNTFGIEARAKVLFIYDSEESLLEALTHIHTTYAQLPLLHIGDGSNLLFLNDYEGVVLKSQIKGINVIRETDDEIFVEVGAGETCDEFIDYAIQQGWYGMENLSLIPSQIGAAAVQNIGAYGVEVCDVIEEVKGICLADGVEHAWQAKDCRYGYRESIFKEELWCRYAITHVTFRLSKNFTPKLQYGGLVRAIEDAGLSEKTLSANELRNVIINIRRTKLPDPAEQGNAGSFFKNPIVSALKAEALQKEFPGMPSYPAQEGKVKLAAGWRIEQAGWKGNSLGAAAVHDRQALVLVNKGGATGQDIYRLCQAVRNAVSERFGIMLETEVNLL